MSRIWRAGLLDLYPGSCTYGFGGNLDDISKPVRYSWVEYGTSLTGYDVE